MKVVLEKLIKTPSKQKKLLMISFIINIVVISIFYMLATGFENVTNESLSDSDYNQVIGIIISIVFVSLISIILFQWILSMLFISLYDSRKAFNNNIRLIGLKHKDLMKFYFKELSGMQIYAIPIGAILSWVVYYFIALSMSFSEQYLPVNKIMISVVLYYVITNGTILFTFIKNIKKSLIQELRNNYSYSASENNFSVKQYIYFILGFIIIFFNIVLDFSSVDFNLVWIIKLSYFVVFVLFYDLLMLIFHKLIIIVSRILKSSSLLLSENINNGYIKQIRAIIIMVVFSTTIFLGLQMLYKTVRTAGKSVVYEHIHYENVATMSEPINLDIVSNKVSLGLRFKSEINKHNYGYINAVDSKYLLTFESLLLDPKLNSLLTKSNIMSKFDDPNWNGIVFPHNYISQDDIGKEININVNGKDIVFIISAGVFMTNFSKLDLYVSKNFLYKELSLDGLSNIAFFMKDSDITDQITKSESLLEIVNKEKLMNDSYQKAVGGTELVELTSVLVIICAIIMLVNFLIIISKESRIDISKLRGIGLSFKKTYKIYLIQIVLLLLKCIAFTIPLSILFTKIGCYVMLSPNYFKNGMESVFFLTFGLFVFIGILSITIQYLSVRKILYTDYISILRENKA